MSSAYSGISSIPREHCLARHFQIPCRNTAIRRESACTRLRSADQTMGGGSAACREISSGSRCGGMEINRHECDWRQNRRCCATQHAHARCAIVAEHLMVRHRHMLIAVHHAVGHGRRCVMRHGVCDRRSHAHEQRHGSAVILRRIKSFASHFRATTSGHQGSSTAPIDH